MSHRHTRTHHRTVHSLLTLCSLALGVACQDTEPSGAVRAIAPPEGPRYTLAALPDLGQIGVNVNVVDSSFKYPALPAAYNAGVRWARMDFEWSSIYTTKTVVSTAQADTSYARLVNQGLNVLGILSKTPAWAVDSAACNLSAGVTKCAPKLASDWGDYVRYVVTRYPNVKAWEIWNEPNCNAFWTGTDAKFDQLVRVADSVITNYAPGDTALLGGVVITNSTTNTTGERNECEIDSAQDAWLTARLTANPGIKAVGVHKYGLPLRDIMPAIRRTNALVGSRPLWLTEVGTSGSEVPDTSAAAQERNAQALHDIYVSMLSDSVSNWKRTFFWHLYSGSRANGAIGNPFSGILNTRATGTDTLRAYHLLRRLTQGCLLDGTAVACRAVHEKYSGTTLGHLYVLSSLYDPTTPGVDRDSASFAYRMAKFAKFYVSPVARTGFHPLYLCVKSTGVAPLVSTYSDCREGTGYTVRYGMGHAADASHPGMVALYRLYYPSSSDYFLSYDATVIANLVAAGWQKTPSPIGYVWARGGAGASD